MAHLISDAGEGVLLDETDSLIVSSFNVAAGVILEISARVMDAHGQLGYQVFFHTPDSTGTNVRSRLNLSRVRLLSLSVRNSAGVLNPGQCFVTVFITRDTVGTLSNVQTLVAGYVYSNNWLSFPMFQPRPMSYGRGFLRVLTAPTPAAGAQFSLTVPAGFVWRLLSVRAVFTSSISATSRRVGLSFTSGANIFYEGVSLSDITASQTVRFSFAAQAEIAHSGNRPAVVAIPDLLLPAGVVIASTVVTMDAADAWSVPTFYVEQWFEEDDVVS